MNVKTKRVITFVMAVLMAMAIVLPALSARADASNFNTGAQYFTDVTPDKWYYEAVNAMAAAGILNGYGDGTFKPNSPMTAGELATVLWNMSFSKDWCKANELLNRFNNGYYANYKYDYPGPRFEKYAVTKYANMAYGNEYSNLVPLTWDGHVALAIYGDSRINPNNNNVPEKATNDGGAQINYNGRRTGKTYSCRESTRPGDPMLYYSRDMSGLAIVAMSKEYVTRGFAISELVNVLRETGNLEKIYNASTAKALYTNGASIPDWASIVEKYHDVCSASAKTSHETSCVFHDYTWAWNYIDDPGNIKIQGGYANTWFSQDILLAYQAGIVDGVDATGRCNVGATMTRAEVCQMLYNIGAGKVDLSPKIWVLDGQFVRDGKAYQFNMPTARFVATIQCYGPYDRNADTLPLYNSSTAYWVYDPSTGVDIRQQEWPTHPEFWGK